MPAETTWERASLNGAQRAAVNVTTPIDAAWSDDGVTHLPLHSAYAAPEAVSPPSPPVLDEQLRGLLSAALVPAVIDFAVDVRIDCSAMTEMRRDRETECREEVCGGVERCRT